MCDHKRRTARSVTNAKPGPGQEGDTPRSALVLSGEGGVLLSPFRSCLGVSLGPVQGYPLATDLTRGSPPQPGNRPRHTGAQSPNLSKLSPIHLLSRASWDPQDPVNCTASDCDESSQPTIVQATLVLKPLHSTVQQLRCCIELIYRDRLSVTKNLQDFKGCKCSMNK